MQFPAFQIIACDSSFQHNSVELENWNDQFSHIACDTH